MNWTALLSIHNLRSLSCFSYYFEALLRIVAVILLFYSHVRSGVINFLDNSAWRIFSSMVSCFVNIVLSFFVLCCSSSCFSNFFVFLVNLIQSFLNLSLLLLDFFLFLLELDNRSFVVLDVSCNLMLLSFQVIEASLELLFFSFEETFSINEAIEKIIIK